MVVVGGGGGGHLALKPARLCGRIGVAQDCIERARGIRTEVVHRRVLKPRISLTNWYVSVPEEVIPVDQRDG